MLFGLVLRLLFGLESPTKILEALGMLLVVRFLGQQFTLGFVDVVLQASTEVDGGTRSRGSVRHCDPEIHRHGTATA